MNYVSKVAVVYKSKYGSTKNYANWIAEEVDATLYESSDFRANEISKYDTVIYGGGLYASGIAGISVITKNYELLKDKNLIVFTVGLASTKEKEVFIPIIDKNFTKEMQGHIKFFHLRGGIEYNKLGLIHKAMMAMLKKMITKKEPGSLTDEDKGLLATYGKKVDFTDKDSISPIIAAINN